MYTTIVLADLGLFFGKTLLHTRCISIDLVSDLTVFSGMDM